MSDHLIGFLRFFYVCIIEPAETQEANFAYICNCKVIFQRCEDKKMNPIIIICTIAIVVNGKEGKAGILVETADFVCNISSRPQLVVPYRNTWFHMKTMHGESVHSTRIYAGKGYSTAIVAIFKSL